MRVLNEVWGALRAHSRVGLTFHDGNINFLILRIFYLSCLGKLTFYLNPLVPQLITPNRRLRWDISSISAIRPQPRAGVAKRSVCSGIDEIRWSRGPGVDSRPGFEIFGGRTRAEWLGRRAQLATGTCKARHGQLTTASISHSRDPQVVSHQGTARALFWSRWGA